MQYGDFIAPWGDKLNQYVLARQIKALCSKYGKTTRTPRFPKWFIALNFIVRLITFTVAMPYLLKASCPWCNSKIIGVRLTGYGPVPSSGYTYYTYWLCPRGYEYGAIERE